MSDLTGGTGIDNPVTEVVRPPVILFVDDEANILSALKRLFRSSGFKLLTAESGSAGLALLAEEPVDLIISDMRMPVMNGAQFLAQAKKQYPEAIRILLTGYSEMDATISAINDGGIYRYLQKPWDEHDLVLTVQQALEQQELKRETARLTAIVQLQNEQLTAFNNQLEVQVAARTGEIQQTVMFLEKAQEDLKQNFMTMLKVFSNLIELRAGMLGGNSSRIAELSQRLGRKFDMSEMAVQELMVAGLLHAIGKIGLPDDLIRKPQDQLTAEELKQFLAHAVKGQMILTPLESFAGAGRIIRHQYERFDGRGTPNALAGDAIPLGARILAVVRDFEALRSGAVTAKPVPDERVVPVLLSQRAHRYDPLVVDRFVELLSEPGALEPSGTRLISSHELSPGLHLAEDLMSREGVLLLTKNSLITPHYVSQIRKFEEIDNAPLRILITVGLTDRPRVDAPVAH
jgi:adenylate cyclase